MSPTDSESRQVFARPLKDEASPVVASTSENENAASWKRRYPNLAKHLELGKFLIQTVTWLAAIGIVVLTVKECRAETDQLAATDLRITFEVAVYSVRSVKCELDSTAVADRC